MTDKATTIASLLRTAFSGYSERWYISVADRILADLPSKKPARLNDTQLERWRANAEENIRRGYGRIEYLSSTDLIALLDLLDSKAGE